LVAEHLSYTVLHCSISASTNTYYTRLQGLLPPETVLFTELNEFNILNMGVGGNLTNHFSNASLLQTLVLGNTNFDGTIPLNLARQNPNLRKLVLSKNRFHGTLPTSLATLQYLTDLQLDQNMLSGHIADNAFSSLNNLGKKYRCTMKECCLLLSLSHFLNLVHRDSSTAE